MRLPECAHTYQLRTIVPCNFRRLHERVPRRHDNYRFAAGAVMQQRCMQHEGCDDTAVLAAAVRNDDRVASGKKREDDGVALSALRSIGSNAPCGKREMDSMMVLTWTNAPTGAGPVGLEKGNAHRPFGSAGTGMQTTDDGPPELQATLRCGGNRPNLAKALRLVSM